MSAPIDSAAQAQWAQRPIRQRLRMMRPLRGLLATEGERLAEVTAEARRVDTAQVMASEVIPLAEAVKYLQTHAKGVLKPRRCGFFGKPLWLPHKRARVERVAKGTVLVIGPGNYPLFLAGSQILQALAAGNAVLIKPAPHCERPIEVFVELLSRAGLPDGLCQILPTTAEAAQRAIAGGVDHVIFTGSETTGKQVAAQCAETLTPCTLELSGVDAAFVLADADLDLVEAALRFGLSINHGRTCVAPRRIIAEPGKIAELRTRLSGLLTTDWPWPTSDALRLILRYHGGKVLCGEIDDEGTIVRYPIVIAGLDPSHPLAMEDYFAPLALLFEADSPAHALEIDAQCPMALGASVFTRTESKAAPFRRAGTVTVNDMIAPTVDPRVPFGGIGRSGYGTTRGPEGLLELTRPLVLTYSKSYGVPMHLRPVDEFISKALPRLLELGHGSARMRFAALKKLVQLGRDDRKSSQTK